LVSTHRPPVRLRRRMPGRCTLEMSIETAQEFVSWMAERHAPRPRGRTARTQRLRGHAQPSSPNVVALIDTALPPQIARQLETYLPLFSAHFTQKLGALGYTRCFSPPTTCRADGRWSAGGTLPGRCSCISMARFGRRGSTTGPAGRARLVFSRTRRAHVPDEAWADGDVKHGYTKRASLCALALRAQGAGNVAEAKVASARPSDAAVAQTSVRDAIAAGKFDVAYSSGFWSAWRSTSGEAHRPGGDGLYKVWRDFIASEPPAAHGGGFPRRVQRAGGDRLADEVRMIVRTPGRTSRNWAPAGRSQPIPIPCRRKPARQNALRLRSAATGRLPQAQALGLSNRAR